jgi:hypothetical protein
MMIYNCLQCDVGPMDKAQARAHFNQEGHEVEEDFADFDDPYDERDED